MKIFQKTRQQSLQFQLSAWLSLATFCVTILAGIGSYLVAYQEAIELQDEQLRQMASLINRQNGLITQTDSADNHPGVDIDDRVFIQPLYKGVKPTSKPANNIDLPNDLADGIQTIVVHKVSWRVFLKSLGENTRVALSQQTAVRDEVAQDSALRTCAPMLILLPVILLLMNGLIRKMLRPLKIIADELDQRDEQDLREITNENLPAEIQPFIHAMNTLLARIADSVSLQRRFVADAAHELRSPVTALSLQAERLDETAMPTLVKERVTALRKGIARTSNLLEQLLTLARVQESLYQPPKPVPILPVFLQVLEDLVPMAQAKNIDIGVTHMYEASIKAQETDVYILIKNLIDNAIRYTPSDGKIDISLITDAQSLYLQIADSGPGIAIDERNRIFDPFYRVLGSNEAGSGLGLSIVQAIALRLGCKINLRYTDEITQKGLSVSISFPIIH